MRTSITLFMGLRYRLMDIRGRGIYSNYADAHKCIFIHIPKTAGISLSFSLFDKAINHSNYREYEVANKKKYAKYYKFSFVRNPWDRLVSSYFFLKKGGLNEMDKKWANEHIRKFKNFDDFVMRWINEDNIWKWVHFKPQYSFICNENDEIMVDYVGHMETINTDYKYISATLGCKKKLFKKNISVHRDYRSYYTQEVWDKIAKVYKKDIEIFGYSGEKLVVDGI